VTFDQAIDTKQLAGVKGVRQVSRGSAANSYRLSLKKGGDPRVAVFRWAVAQGRVILEMRQETRSVEDVFRQLTAAR
jgi:hypothetical protein